MSDPRLAVNGPVRFGVFELDPSAGEVRKQGVRIRLQDQPLQVLQILLEKPGQVVTREELQRRLWPSNTFVEFDKGIYNAIKRLRETLGDDAETPRYIETIPRRGYRFIGSVQKLGGEAPVAPTAITIDSIVVLPFINMSSEPENEYLADGITEEIINALAQIRELHVVARSSAFSFKGKHIDLRVVGEQLNVRTVLEGSVRRADNRLRITVQLVNAADGYHLWSERYDKETKDIFDVQDEIARSVAERLKITLEGSRPERLVKAGTKNLEAYQLYAKGRVLLTRQGPAVANVVDCFERAVRLDPNYAQAWAGLADSYTVLGYSGLVRPEMCMPQAMEAARRAVTLDPSLAEAHAALAMACLTGTWDKGEAERESLRALELNPRYVQARCWYAFSYLQYSEGRMAEGMMQAKRALESDPLSSYAHAVYGHTCAFAGKCAEAVQASGRAVELDSESYLARVMHQEVLHFTGKLKESVAAGQLALAMSGRHPWSMVFLALTFSESGKAVDADAVYEEMLGRARHQYLSPALLAFAAAAASREDEVIRHAREAFEIRDPQCQFVFSRHAPWSARLYADRRFREIISSMGRTDWLRD
jgi:TolB-like protein/cytochrome c-type biogenesis protein CcmH/NrfG